MTKDEIKKALTCCSNPSISYCKDCPYANYGEFDCCNGKMCKDALDLITEQENEIELLKMQMKDVVNHADTFLAEEQKFEAENVKLKAEIKDLKDEIIYLERKIAIRDNALKDRDKAIEMLEGKQDTIVKQAKIDVLNEAKKCSCCDNFFPDGQWHRFVFVSDIDILIKRVENDK